MKGKAATDPTREAAAIYILFLIATESILTAARMRYVPRAGFWESALDAFFLLLGPAGLLLPAPVSIAAWLALWFVWIRMIRTSGLGRLHPLVHVVIAGAVSALVPLSVLRLLALT